MQTMFTFGARSGVETFRPYAAGDQIVVKGERWVIESVSDNIHGDVLLCISLKDGRNGIWFPREVSYRASGRTAHRTDL